MTAISDIVTAAQELMGEVAGVGVQTYGEDITIQHAIRAFNMMHMKYPWDEYIEWKQLILDGVTGRLTTSNDFDYVRDFGDFISVQPTGTTWELSVLGHKENPFALDTGTTVRRYTSIPVTDASYTTKRLQFWPKASTGTLDIQVRVYPKKITEVMDADTVVYLDKDLLVYATTFQHLALDDTNSNALNIVQNMLEVRYNDLTNNRANKPIQISGGSGIPAQWSESPY